MEYNEDNFNEEEMENELIIEEHEKWFKFYENMPILGTALWVTSALIGIIVLLVTKKIEFDRGLLYLGLNAIISICIYLLLKLVCVCNVLRIYYLKKLVRLSELNANKENVSTSNTQEVICKKE